MKSHIHNLASAIYLTNYIYPLLDSEKQNLPILNKDEFIGLSGKEGLHYSGTSSSHQAAPKGLGLETKERKTVFWVQVPALWIVSILSLQMATCSYMSLTQRSLVFPKKSGMSVDGSQWSEGQAANILDTHV